MEHINNLKRNRKISLILASHNLRQISEICDRVLLIEEGKIVKDDHSYSIIKKYTMDEKNISKIIFSKQHFFSFQALDRYAQTGCRWR